MRRTVSRSIRRVLRLLEPDPAEERRRLATSPQTKVALRQLFITVRTAAALGQPLPALRDAGFRLFSQDDEDGLILFLLAVIGIGPRHFVDIGAGNCVSASNCANLALNFGFHGLFVDGDAEGIASGRAFYAAHPDTRLYPPKTVHAFVTRENVNDIIRSAGFEGDIDVLSIDIDGNDHWIWGALDCVRPNIVVIETHTEYRMQDIASAYRPDFDWRTVPADDPVGASPVAMARLGAELGYRLVGSNRYGFNAVFVRDDLAVDVVPTVGPDALLQHPWSQESNE
jgi:hypothetical protein